MPIEGFVVKGSFESESAKLRTAEDVNADFVDIYSEICERSGEIIAKEVVVTEIQKNTYRVSSRLDTHILVNFPELSPVAQ